MKRRTAVRGLAALLAATAAGCERKPGAATEGTGSGSAPAEATHLRRHMEDSPRTIDPALITDVPTLRLSDDLFEGLTRLDAAGNVVPAIARRWTSSADGLDWVFELREDARWSNGDRVVAEDFVYAWRRLLDPATRSQLVQQVTPLGNALAIIEGKASPDTLAVRSRGDHVLEVHLDQRTPWFLYLLTNTFLMPVHRATVERAGAQWTRVENIVSSGPYKLVSMRINGAIQVEKNPYHHDAASIRIERITYFPITDRGAATSRYLAGDIDISDGLQLDDIGWLRRRLQPGEVRLSPYYGTVMFGFHATRPPFDSRPLREALNLAIDREVLTGKVLRGVFLPAYNIVPPVPGYEPAIPEWAHWPRERREARARELYAEAGYSKERPLSVEIAYVIGDPDNDRLLEALSAMWRMVLGADIRLAAEEFRVLRQNQQTGKHTFFWYAWIGDYPDPLSFLELLRRISGQNFGQYDNPPFERLLDAAVASPDDAERAAKYAQAEALLNDDAINLPVYFYTSRHLLKPDVRGWQDNVMNRHSSRDLWLERGAPGTGG